MKNLMLAGMLSALMFFCPQTSFAQDAQTLFRNEIGIGTQVRTNGFQPWLVYKLNLGPEGKSALRSRVRVSIIGSESSTPEAPCRSFGNSWNKSRSAALDLGYERRIPAGNFAFYYGGDIQGSLTHNASHSDATAENCVANNLSYQTQDLESQSLRLGLQPVIGFRWLPISRIVLALEFAAPVNYTRTTVDRSTRVETSLQGGPLVTETYDQKTSFEQFSFGPGMALFFSAAFRL